MEAVLDKNWSWKQRDPSVDVLGEIGSDGWKPATSFPSEIHVELIKAGLIPGPFVGFNEHKVQWIGHVEWLYKSTFPFNSKSKYATLEFLGLDTVCDVYLNDTKILECDNQFQTHNVQLDIPSLNKENSLLLHFKSAADLAKTIEAQRGKVRAGSTNLGDPSRVYVRKAQYDWRWDWGPELMTVGPYRPIVLKTYDLRIAEVHIRTVYSPSTSEAQLKVDVTIEGDLASHGLRVSLADLNGELIRSQTLALDSLITKNAVDWTFSAGSVQAWWPVGYGNPTLYQVQVDLLQSNHIIHTHNTTTGFRSVALIQEPLETPDQYGTGTTFLFEINGVRMFMGGSNWIPASNFLTTLTPAHYRAWLSLFKEGNQNCIRIWGGGIYEPDCFYEICDELGIVVWQDFQFACGVYPAHDEFVKSVRKEAEDNVKRLRHHPSIILFCGNNEDYQMVLQWGDVESFPAIKLYEDVLPSVVETLTDPPIPYHRGSPYGGKGWDTADPTIGDVHQWNVWGGKELHYQEYDKLGGRFVSEFGMPAHPNIKTIAYWLDGETIEKQNSQSPIMAQHCRAGVFERRFAIAMNDNFKLTSDLETTVYNTQLMQAEAVGWAYQSWRRAWAGPGKQYTSGVLVWQLNDCWPVTSWAIADYFLRPKPAYFAIKRHLATFSVGILRNVIKHRPSDRPRQFYEFGGYQSIDAKLDIWAGNATLSPQTVTLELYCVDLKSNWEHKETHQVVLPPNQSINLFTDLQLPSPPKTGVHAVSPTGFDGWTTSHSVVVGARLLDPKTGKVLARHADFPQPLRFIEAYDPGLKLTSSGEIVEITTEKPVKCLVLSVTGDEDVRWDDNGMDLMPGDTRVLHGKGLNGRSAQVAYLGKEKGHLLN